jgi:hypothetical protein
MADGKETETQANTEPAPPRGSGQDDSTAAPIEITALLSMPGFEARTADKKTSPSDTLPAAPDQGSKQDDPQAARDKAEMSALSSRESKPGRPQRG